MNKYQQQYESLIHFRQVEHPLDSSIKHVHRHHIKPKCLYKSLEHDPTNIVRLYVLEHVEAHRLIMLWYKDQYGILSTEFQKMSYAYQHLAGIYDKSSSIYKQMRQLIDHATSLRNQNSIWINDGKHEFFVLKSRIQTEFLSFTVGRLSQPNKDKIIVTDGIHNKFVFENCIPDGFYKGFTTSSTKGKIWITNDYKQTLIEKDEVIPDGWHYGSCSKPTLGTVWINNGTIMKRVKPENIPKGWVRGKLSHKSKGKLIYVNDGIHTIKVAQDAIPDGYVKGCLCCAKNRKWINNGIIRKQLKDNEPLPDGFSFGYKLKPNSKKI